MLQWELIILLGLPYLGVCTDFITVLFTGHNMDKALFIILGYVWVGGALYFSVIIYFELTMPEKKKYILPIYFFIGIVYTKHWNCMTDALETFDGLFGNPLSRRVSCDKMRVGKFQCL